LGACVIPRARQRRSRFRVHLETRQNLSTSTNDHETELTKKQAGSFLDASRQEAASGHGGKFSRKRKAHSVTDITECMTELPDYACSEIGGVDRESIRNTKSRDGNGGCEKKETRSVAVTIRLRPSTKALLERRAAEEGRSVTNYLENLIVRNGEKSSQGRPRNW